MNVEGGCGGAEDAAGTSLLGDDCCGGGEFAENVGFAVIGGFPPGVRPAFTLALGTIVMVSVVAESV